MLVVFQYMSRFHIIFKACRSLGSTCVNSIGQLSRCYGLSLSKMTTLIHLVSERHGENRHWKNQMFLKQFFFSRRNSENKLNTGKENCTVVTLWWKSRKSFPRLKTVDLQLISRCNLRRHNPNKCKICNLRTCALPSTGANNNLSKVNSVKGF